MRNIIKNYKNNLKSTPSTPIQILQNELTEIFPPISVFTRAIAVPNLSEIKKQFEKLESPRLGSTFFAFEKIIIDPEQSCQKLWSIQPLELSFKVEELDKEISLTNLHNPAQQNLHIVISQLEQEESHIIVSISRIPLAIISSWIWNKSNKLARINLLICTIFIFFNRREIFYS